jgi:hypothetical protein
MIFAQSAAAIRENMASFPLLVRQMARSRVAGLASSPLTADGVFATTLEPTGGPDAPFHRFSVSVERLGFRRGTRRHLPNHREAKLRFVPRADVRHGRRLLVV